MPLKIASWNVEYADRLLKAGTAAAKDRKERVKKTLQAIDPDIFCLVEGPAGEKGAVDFATSVLGGEWVPVLLSDAGGAAGSRDRDYATQGIQWIWFFVKPGLKSRCRLRAPADWQQLTGRTSWKLYLWGKPGAQATHSHYRHPQMLVYTFDNGESVELIGVHLKSGYMDKTLKIERDEGGNLTGPYLDEALTNRIKLATEAHDVRLYISGRFGQEAKPPAMVVLGDCNDGEGQDYFESYYLFFSIVSNLEGDVVHSGEFFNHALFDYDPARRWSIKFADEVTGLTADENPLLLDHILMSQPLCNGSYPVVANARGGQVEHDAYEAGNPTGKTPTSDHRPVSMKFDDT